MSDEPVGQQATQATQATPAAQVADFFERAERSGTQARLYTVSGTCQFNIEGAGTWYVTMRAGAPSITQDPTKAPPPDSVVTMSAPTFARIINREGYINIFAAFLQGLVSVSGDLSFAAAILGSAIVEREP